MIECFTVEFIVDVNCLNPSNLFCAFIGAKVGVTCSNCPIRKCRNSKYNKKCLLLEIFACTNKFAQEGSMQKLKLFLKIKMNYDFFKTSYCNKICLWLVYFFSSWVKLSGRENYYMWNKKNKPLARQIERAKFLPIRYLLVLSKYFHQIQICWPPN